jgi:hypothetical protein
MGWTKGKPQTPESNRKRAEAMTGRTLSRRHRARISRGLKRAYREGRRG